MDTAVLERPVRQKTWGKTQSFEKSKPQIKVNNACSDEICDNYDLFDDYPEVEYELSEEGKKSLERALNDIRIGNVRTLATPKNWKG
jgi:hypothetical protein